MRLVDKKIKLKVWLAPLKLLFLKFFPVTRFKDPKAAILTLKMPTGSRP
jgi:hypothetical protein